MNRLDDLRHVFEEDAARVAPPPGVVDRALRAGVMVRRRRWAGAATVVVAAAIAVPTLLINQNTVADGFIGPGEPTVTSVPGTDDDEAVAEEVTGDADGFPLGEPPTLPYAIGSTIVDGETRLDVGGEVRDFVRVGDEFAVIIGDGVDDRLDLVALDGEHTPLDAAAHIFGLAAGDAPGEVLLAWASSPGLDGPAFFAQVSALVDTTGRIVVETIDIDQTTNGVVQALEIIPDGVVFAEIGDPGGPAQLWNLTAHEITPLLPEAGDLGPILLTITDDQVAVSYDSFGSGCIGAYQLPGDGAPLWERCVEQGWYQISPDGHWLFDTSAVADARTGSPAVELQLGEWGFADVAWEDADTMLLSMDNGVVRCRMPEGTCERAPVGSDGGWLADGHVVFSRW